MGKKRYILLALVLSWKIRADAVQNPGATEQENSRKEKTRIVAFSGYSRADLNIFFPVPVSYKNETGGPDTHSVLGRMTNTTRAGSLSLASRVGGEGSAASFFVLGDNYQIGLSGLNANLSLTPMQDSILPYNTFKGRSKQEIYNLKAEYYFKNKTRITPTVAYNLFHRNGEYEYRNIYYSPQSSSEYISIPRLHANDRMKNNNVQAGLRFDIHSAISLEPYYQYRSQVYEINFHEYIGSKIRHDQYFLPTGEVFQSWGSVYNTGLAGKATLDSNNIGLKIQGKIKRAIFLRLDIRRNLKVHTWNVSAGMTVMFHPNFGITAAFDYLEPEINPIYIRTWNIGPIFTTTL